MGQQGFWDVEARQAKLAAQQSILEHLNAVIPWEQFRPTLEQLYEKPRKSQAGRKPIDVILMLKLGSFLILVILRQDQDVPIQRLRGRGFPSPSITRPDITSA
jgi:hypothetical protein